MAKAGKSLGTNACGPNPEIDVGLKNGRRFKTRDWRWDGQDFVVVDPASGSEYVFTDAYFSGLGPPPESGPDARIERVDPERDGVAIIPVIPILR